MARVSQAQARENRERIVATAARLFRERGVAGVSVADVSAAAGLTHGGFYKQFASKDALVDEAIGYAFQQQAARLGDSAGLPAFLDTYLSTGHRDDPGPGCPTAGFAGDVARAAGGPAARQTYADGVAAYARMLGTDGEPDLAAVSMLVGALMLSRATAGTEISEQLLTAARDRLREG
ncbi:MULTISPECIES: TetR/AcrR family transcriptional regulator [Actinoplanes]|uniref:TetR family transcriptional regulator n=2 Tax=Actinoplanes TaxID=1865 RepID=A0A0X3V5G5_9ACTN|nr:MULTISPECIES: TetR family transcriptional regulator [Actinoplanes]KUL39894.1 TetR family transcriptional regulator [Actinoplanes awajinensis subsp. mycoplanecinus]GIE68704.1 TetR family transcriptional regulator [Actinoplanes palleronii]